MSSRRSFLSRALEILAAGGGLLVSSWSVVPRGWAKLKRVLLPPGTQATRLQNKVPRELDTRHLLVTPINKFGTMGQTDVVLDPKTWRLEVGGAVARPLRLTYDQILKMPPVEKKVLLICPGVFSYHARWRGVSLGRLLRLAGVKGGVASVVIKGPAGQTATTKSFSIQEIERGDVFLATHVNGRPLPRKHGFPLRVVARDHYGYDWVKYVSTITAHPAPAKAAG
ncbi:MAG: molybdopterin-dependent oxidoreductase [Proteobacteria bacterium]|nr:molybdopterin-dependent oxidoreductase [Pseudomonadota bacterium]MBU1742303.1 molybdopterin-dependent oxidoreductase [Pseudomonadota bacterium]